MIFLRTLLREFANLAVAVFLTLFLIALTTRLIRCSARPRAARFPSDAVVAFLGFSALNLLPVLLSLTLFITRAAGAEPRLARFRDGDLVQLRAVARGLAAPGAAVRGAAGGGDRAAVARRLALVRRDRRAVPQPDRLARRRLARGAGRVRRVARQGPGFFVESIAGDKSSVQNVFVASVQHRRTGVMMSERGFAEYAPNGDRFLTLLEGRRYEGAPGEADYSLMEFERYATRIQARGERRSRGRRRRACPRSALIAEPDRAQPRRTDVAHRHSALGADPRAAGDPDELRQSARGALGQPAVRAAHLHGVLRTCCR